MTNKDLQALSRYRNERGAISLYIYSSTEDRVRDFTERLKSLFDSMRNDIKTAEWPRGIKKDAAYILNAKDMLVQKFTWHKRKTYCVFIADDFCRYYELPIRVKDRITVDDKFYMTPLFLALEQFERYAVLIFNRKKTRLFNYYVDDLQEEAFEVHEYAVSNIRGAALKGRAVSNKIEEALHKHLKEMNELLLADFKTHGFDRLILGSHEEDRGLVKGYLHSYLLPRLAGDIKADPGESDIAIKSRIREAVASYRKEAETKKITELNAMHAHGKAVHGLIPVLVELGLDNISELVMVHDFHAEGYVCLDRHFLHAAPETDRRCPSCGKELKKENFLEDEIIEEVFLRKGKIFHLLNFPEVIGPHKIGAFLRHSQASP